MLYGISGTFCCLFSTIKYLFNLNKNLNFVIAFQQVKHISILPR